MNLSAAVLAAHHRPHPHQAASHGSSPASPATPASPSTDAGEPLDSVSTPASAPHLSKSVFEPLKGATASFSTMPDFLYPAVFGSAAERTMIYQQLDALPLKDVGTVATVKMVNSVPSPGGGVVMGYEQPGTSSITLSREGCSLTELPKGSGNWVIGNHVNPTVLQGTLTHEVGHAADYGNSMTRVFTGLHPSAHAPFGQGPYVTEYAGSTPQEDFAETYARTHLTPQQLAGQPNTYETQSLQDFNPAKAKAMQKFDKQSFMQHLVDTKAFRDTGREFGKIASAVPLARTGLLMAGRLSSLGLIMTGVGEVTGSVTALNKEGAIKGGLDLGAGLGLGLSHLGPVFAPAAMGLMGAHAGLNAAEKKAAHEGSTASKKALVGAALGGAVGGAAGGFAGPLAGVRLGYAVGGPVGGVVGMITGGLLGYTVASKVGSSVGLRAGGGLH